MLLLRSEFVKHFLRTQSLLLMIILTDRQHIFYTGQKLKVIDEQPRRQQRGIQTNRAPGGGELDPQLSRSAYSDL